MRFVQFNKNGIQKLGVQIKCNGDIVDLNAADSRIPNSLMDLLKGGREYAHLIHPAVTKVLSKIEYKPLTPVAQVKLLPPITNPDKVACVGLNYKGHCEENNLPIPKDPIIFSKFSSCIIGPYDTIKHPSVSDKLDWEVELAVVIGKEGYKIPKDEAMDYVFGFTVAQDISARDWQKELNGGQFLLGKSMDTFCPLGPAVVTKDMIRNVYDLNITTRVNGIYKQRANTSELIHKIDRIIERISSCVTLYPGDVILTGTPAGVGMSMNPPEFLKVGDIITSEISDIGIMENKVV